MIQQELQDSITLFDAILFSHYLATKSCVLHTIFSDHCVTYGVFLVVMLKLLQNATLTRKVFSDKT